MSLARKFDLAYATTPLKIVKEIASVRNKQGSVTECEWDLADCKRSIGNGLLEDLADCERKAISFPIFRGGRPRGLNRVFVLNRFKGGPIHHFR